MGLNLLKGSEYQEGEFTFDSRESTQVMVAEFVPIAQDRRTLVVVDKSVADSFRKKCCRRSLQAQGVAVATLTLRPLRSAKSLKTS